MDAALRFAVDMKPQPRGSKKALQLPHQAFPHVVDTNEKESKAYMQAIGLLARREVAEPTSCPVLLHLRFRLARPAGHYLRGGDLSAEGRRRQSPAVKPDVNKLARGVQDALSGVAYLDDSQVIQIVESKTYVPQRGDPERTLIAVYHDPTQPAPKRTTTGSSSAKRIDPPAK